MSPIILLSPFFRQMKETLVSVTVTGKNSQHTTFSLYCVYFINALLCPLIAERFIFAFVLIFRITIIVSSKQSQSFSRSHKDVNKNKEGCLCQ